MTIALSAPAAAWLDDAVARVAADAAAVAALFPAVGRAVGRSPVDANDPHGLVHGTVDDAARAELLRAVALPGDGTARLLHDLYRFGDAAEKRGLLRGLHRLDVGDRCVDIVQDALRSNDIRLVAAAVGQYGATHLDAVAFRQAVLKCLFMGIPLQAVARLHERADAELAAMVARFARERVAAGRDVPRDVWLVLHDHPDTLQQAGVPDELESPVPERRAAAARLLSTAT